MSNYFPDAINTYKIDIKTDIDIFIPSINLGIEYDGVYFHKQRLSNDISKSERILARGIKLIRIREKGCPIFFLQNCKIMEVEVDPKFNGLNRLLPQLINFIAEISGINISFKEMDIESSVIELKSKFSTISYQKSLESYFYKLKEKNIKPAAIWDYKNNAPLTPRNVSTKSSIEVYWLCPNDSTHKGWKAPIHSVTNGYGCKICSKRRRYTTEEWIIEAKSVHMDKYDYSRVIYIDAMTPIDIICSKHGVFTQTPSQHLSGRGCPFCAGLAFHPNDSLSNTYPQLIKEWDYERNISKYNVKPYKISIHDTRRFYWHCNYGKPHSYHATIRQRLNGSKCAVCHGKQISYDTSLAFLNPELAAEWCSENDKTPYDITPKSDYNALWKCPNPNHEPYRQKVEVRSRGVGCIYCSSKGKKHPKDFEEELRAKFPNIKLLKPFIKASERVKCQCEICGYIWTPFPSNILRGRGCPKCKK